MLNKNKSKILIIGASGKLGGGLTMKLVKQGYDVSILILKNTWHPFLDDLNIKVFYGDITNIKEMEDSFKGITHIFHVAGIVTYNKKIDDLVYKVNFKGVQNTFSLAKKYKAEKIVVTCSTAGHGIPESKNKPITEKDNLDLKKYGNIMYMYSKHLALKECSKRGSKDLNIVSVSPTAIYGQGDNTMHIGKTIKSIKEGKVKVAFPGGDTVVSLDDCIDGHILAMEKGKSGEDYIIANEMLTYQKMFNTIAKVTKAPLIKRTYPHFIMPIWILWLKLLTIILKPFNKKPKTDPQRIYIRFQFRYFNSSKARKELGWTPKQTFEDAIKKAMKYYKKEKMF